MLCKDLKVVALNITEDFYEYKGLFRLCGEEMCINVDLAEFTDKQLQEIKAAFLLEEPIEEIRTEIMSKVFSAVNIESRCVEGKDMK